MYVSLFVFPQPRTHSNSLFPFFPLPPFFPCFPLPLPRLPFPHVWLSLLRFKLMIHTMMPKIPHCLTSTPPSRDSRHPSSLSLNSRHPPQSSPSPNIQPPTVVISPRLCPHARRRKRRRANIMGNIESPWTSKRLSPPLAGSASGAYSCIKSALARQYLISNRLSGPAVSEER